MNRTAFSLLTLALGASLAGNASACTTLNPLPGNSARALNRQLKTRLFPRMPLTGRANAARPNATPDAAANPTVAGLWDVQIFGPDGTEAGEFFDVFYADGMELQNDASPILEGNLCVGVWTQTGPRTFALHHVGWLFDESGIPFGREIDDTVITVDPSGMTFTGSGTGTGYDMDGNVLGSGSGTVQAQRITVPATTSTQAVAGPKDLTTVQREITLDGTASTSADGRPLTYFWTQAPGSFPVAIQHADTAKPAIQFTQVRGKYTFVLTVTDSTGSVSKDTVTVDFEGL